MVGRCNLSRAPVFRNHLARRHGVEVFAIETMNFKSIGANVSFAVRCRNNRGDVRAAQPVRLVVKCKAVPRQTFDAIQICAEPQISARVFRHLDNAFGR